MKSKDLSLIEIIERVQYQSENELKPLLGYLKYEPKSENPKERAEEIAMYLRKMGSHDVKSLFNGPVEYEEVVFDVGKKVGAKVEKENTVLENEHEILLKMFESSLDNMSEDEKKILFQSMNIDLNDIKLGASAAIIIQALGKLGGFATYKYSIIIANMFARSVLGAGLSFATNAALVKTVGVLLGPVGWFASGSYLLFELAGPSFRKTVPAVIHIAYLRQLLQSKVNIGVVGDGSVGKDSLMLSVFGIDTNNISPISGSTEEVETYEMDSHSGVSIINYPGFNDYRPEVNKVTDDYLVHTDIFLMVTDVSRGVTDTDIKIYNQLKKFDRPILVCANKSDIPRPEVLEELVMTTKNRLENADVVRCCFDPDPRLGQSPQGVQEVQEWIKEKLIKAGKFVESVETLTRK